jgi:hypothetical protein
LKYTNKVYALDTNKTEWIKLEFLMGPENSAVWCHYCDKNNHNTTDFIDNSKFKQQKNSRLEANFISIKNSLVLFLKTINAIKGSWSLKRLQATRRGGLYPFSLY